MKFTEDYKTIVKDSDGRVIDSYESKGQFSPVNAIGSLSGVVIAIGLAIIFSVAALIFLPLWFIVNNNLYRLNKIESIFDTSDEKFQSLLQTLGIKSFKSFKFKMKIKVYIFNTLFIISFIIGVFAFLGLNIEQTWISAIIGALFVVSLFTIVYIILFNSTNAKMNSLVKELDIKEKRWLNIVFKLLIIIYFATLPFSFDFAKNNGALENLSAKAIQLYHSKVELEAERKALQVYELYNLGFITKETVFKSDRYSTDTLLDYLFTLNKSIASEVKYYGNSPGTKIMQFIFEELISKNSLYDFNKVNNRNIDEKKEYRNIKVLRYKYKKNLEEYYNLEQRFELDEYIVSIYKSLGLLLILLLGFKFTIKQRLVKQD